jgi:hypothetical protein
MLIDGKHYGCAPYDFYGLGGRPPISRIRRIWYRLTNPR